MIINVVEPHIQMHSISRINGKYACITTPHQPQLVAALERRLPPQQPA